MIAVNRRRRGEKAYVQSTRFLVRKSGRKGNLRKKKASPMSSTSILQMKFWMKRVAKNKEQQRKGEHQKEKKKDKNWKRRRGKRKVEKIE